MSTLAEIEQLAANYAAARAALTDRVAILQTELDALTRRELRSIRQSVAEAASCYDQLHHAIEAAPELFDKPRTHTFSGIRCGWMLGKDSIEFPDEAETIRRIRLRLPEDQAELLIAVTERVDKQAALNLTAADHKRLRMIFEPGKDAVFIKPADSAVDKIVAALLMDAERIEEHAA